MRKKLDNIPRQRNLFDYIRELQELDKKSTEGTFNVSDKLRMALTHALKQCPLSRHQVAGEMSHLLGIEVNRTTIDSWTAESKPGNRIPAEYIPAFCKVTNNYEALVILNQAAGRFSMPGPDALRSEIQKWAERERTARAEKRKRELFLKEMEVDIK